MRGNLQCNPAALAKDFHFGSESTPEAQYASQPLVQVWEGWTNLSLKDQLEVVASMPIVLQVFREAAKWGHLPARPSPGTDLATSRY